ncbi:hypothetical protein PRIPAC_74506 [Pristionchus pacificus]|uniref:Uncharacterized protein n=1 Tax=Pristionchus pacificus TaxID=54126 RepID=A0A454Y1F0_PRIPA|nr:hypothetical protein PRIPAC_74506 [Pristionchus pacificus]|eukprot:PDM74082.1 hypothetical protein PRIPAC_41438 [Pristionchus pacificus]
MRLLANRLCLAHDIFAGLLQQEDAMGVSTYSRQQHDICSCATPCSSLGCTSCVSPALSACSSSSSSNQSADRFTVISADSAAPLHHATRIRTTVVLKEFNKVWRGLQPVPDYRLWIYSVNGLIITFQCIVGYLAYSSWQHAFWRLIPLPSSSALYIVFACTFVVQLLACVCGLVGVFISSRDFIKIYWCLMIPLLFIDVMQFIMAAYQLMKIHVSFASPPPLITNSSLCPVWIEFAKEFSCSTECEPSNFDSDCAFVLLRWMHGRLDIVGVLMCFVLFPLKIIVILALREDIQELFEEIVYSDNERLYKHWALGDEEEDDCDRDREKTERENRQTNAFAA